MTSFQKIVILVGLLQGEIVYGIWGVSPFLSLISPVVAVANFPGIRSGVEFGRLVANPKTRNEFLKDSVLGTAFYVSAAAYYAHTYLGMSHEYKNGWIAKAILCGGATLFVIQESVNKYQTASLAQRIGAVRQQVEDVRRDLGERIGAVGGQVEGVRAVIHGEVLPVATTTQQTVRRIEPEVTNTAAAAARLEGAVGAVAGQARVLQQRLGLLSLEVFTLNKSLGGHGVMLAGIQDAQAQHGADLAGLGKQVGAAAAAAARQHEDVTGRLGAIAESQAAIAISVADLGKKQAAQHAALMQEVKVFNGAQQQQTGIMRHVFLGFGRQSTQPTLLPENAMKTANDTPVVDSVVD